LFSGEKQENLPNQERWNMNFRLLTRILVCVFIASAIAPLTRADVLYVFSGAITPYSFLPGGASQSFTYDSANFITQDTTASAASLSQCSTGYYATCQGIGFLVSSPGWGGPKGQVVQLAFWDGVVNPYYYFPANAFGADGVYDSVSFPGANTATLVVESTSAPEPGTLALLMSAPLSFGCLARRKLLCQREKAGVPGPRLENDGYLRLAKIGRDGWGIQDEISR
jgi:hypothetical protein